MKNFFVSFALFAALIFVISCGGSSKTYDEPDSGETLTDEDSADAEPTEEPTDEPTNEPTDEPTDEPTNEPTPDEDTTEPTPDEDTTEPTPDEDTTEPTPDEDVDTTPEPTEPITGIYFGIIGFNKNQYIKEIGLLNDSTEHSYKNFIDDLSLDIYTALYFADYTALEMMREYEEPPKLKNVALVTFTDGLDILAMNPNYNPDPENYTSYEAYRNALHDMIVNDEIHGQTVAAYTIGLKGSDVNDDEEFDDTLEKLASEPVDDYRFLVSDMDEVKEHFKKIAEDLYSVSKTVDLNVEVSSGYENGQVLRFTFDINCDHDSNTCDGEAKDSNLYIEATYHRTGTAVTFEEITYKGFADDDIPTSISSVPSDDGIAYLFKFEDIKYTDGTTSLSDNDYNRIELWKKTSNGIWNHETEFERDNASELLEDENSALIMLVLDCTTSLGNSDFVKMQQAGKDFVTTLANGGTDTRVAKCTGLPENAQWNTASKITQTFNGTSWIPSTVGTYNVEASTERCRYKCKSGYAWNGSACVLPTTPCDPNQCTSLAHSTGTCTISGTKYICGCNENYNWNPAATKCDAATQNVNCTGLPTNASWNTATSITQTWNGSAWVPSSTGSYSTTASTTECRFKCKTNYNWTSSTQKCEPATQQGTCSSKPANTVWNDSGANGKYTQTWNGSSFAPSSYTSGYSTTAGTCRYKCDSTHFWNGSACVSPCDAAPCSGIANSTGSCTATSAQAYSCGCNSGYYWNGLKCSQTSLSNLCTGQTACYNTSSSITCPTSESADYFGQDPQYSTCTAQSFTVQTISSQKVVVDNNIGLMWQQTIPSTTYDWTNATNYCSNLEYAGYSDWRLPTPVELMTIVNNSKYNPAVLTSYFSNMPSSASDKPILWTNKSYNSSTALVFYPYWGSINSQSKTSTYLSYLMCVRGANLPTSSFTTQMISGENVVKDSTTGLMWQKAYPTSTYTWSGALNYCKNLTYAGYSDWRVPNKNELAALLDYSKTSAPYSSFPGMNSSYFWSTSTQSNGTSNAWTVYFGDGTINTYGKSNGNYVMCVR